MTKNSNVHPIQQDEGEQKNYGPSHHIYGGKAALTFDTDITKQDVHTIAIDGAKSTGPKQYDWKNKVRIQLTQAELPVVAAVFFGLLESCRYQNHGPENNKGFEFVHQGDKVFCKLFAPGTAIAVPVMMPDVFQVCSLFTRQFRKEHPWISSVSDIMNLLSKTVAR